MSSELRAHFMRSRFCDNYNNLLAKSESGSVRIFLFLISSTRPQKARWWRRFKRTSVGSAIYWGGGQSRNISISRVTWRDGAPSWSPWDRRCATVKEKTFLYIIWSFMMSNYWKKILNLQTMFNCSKSWSVSKVHCVLCCVEEMRIA